MKILSSLSLLVFAISLNAQTVVFSDSFDSYLADDFLGPQSGDWTTWSGIEGGTEDGTVSTTQFESAPNSLFVEGDNSNGGTEDVFLPFNAIDPNLIYDLHFDLFIPSGFGAYFNIQETTNAGDGWVLDVFFPSFANSTFEQNGAVIGSNAFNLDQWMSVDINFDLDANTIEVFLDGNSYGMTSYTGSIGGLNFFAYAGGGGTIGSYYIDNVELTESIPVVLPNEITPCEAGFAGLYPCDKIDLLSIVPLSDIGTNIEANDIWGWTDPLDGKEYVLLGLTSGTAFIDIADPINPEYLGFLPTHTSNSLWRDMKVFSNHAFIVSEANGHGMQVFDLTRLRNVANPPETFTEDAHYGDFGRAHNIAINEESGMAYAVGTTTFSGGLHIVDINNPLVPQLVGSYALDGYTHDAQVVNYIGPDPDYFGEQVAFNANEDALTIALVTDPTDTQTISSEGYVTSSYAHQGWLTPDHKYYLMGDEIDELDNNVTSTTTYIWDVQDLDQPVLIGTYEGPSNAIDHNLYTRGNMVFQANYRAGFRVLDAQDVANGNLSEVAFFDLYPSSDGTQFNGAWSNYPYFESNVMAVSHIEEGLFLLLPQFLNISANEIEQCSADDVILDVVVEPGFAGPVSLSVDGLPAEVEINFSNNGVGDGTTVQLTLSNLNALSGDYEVIISGDNGAFVFEQILNLSLLESFQYFLDADNDTYGDPDNSIFSCTPVAGYVSNDLDCLDSNEFVFDGAPGTGENIDNNCNGFIEGDELSQSICEGDANGDGLVNILDLVAVSSDFGCISGCQADANFDGEVNILDLISVSSNFGNVCS